MLEYSEFRYTPFSDLGTVVFVPARRFRAKVFPLGATVAPVSSQINLMFPMEHSEALQSLATSI